MNHDLHELIRKAISPMPKHTQIAIAMIAGGEVRFLGARRIDTTSFYTRNHYKLFEIGSITKVFTSTLLADFVLEAQIKLDETVESHLPVCEKDN